MKFEELPKTDKKGRELYLENGIITGVSLSAADHACLCGWLHIEFKGGGCSFGGLVLGKVDEDNLKAPGNYAGEWILRCLKTVGAEKWEDIPKRPIRCLHEGIGGGIIAVGHFMKDEWFCPSLEFTKGK